MPPALDPVRLLPAPFHGGAERVVRRSGFSLVEMVVALVVMGIVAMLVLPLLLGARAMVESDQLRTATNQGVRAGSDLIGTDIRMAGERFPRGGGLSLSPIQIIPGGGSPDEIILRRNLWDGTLPVCELTLNDADATIAVVRLASDAFWAGVPGTNHPECGQPLDANGWPMSLAAVKDLADSTTTNGVLRGYVLDPATGQGEFLDFEVLDDADATGVIARAGSGALVNTYQLANRPLIYILDERQYRINSGILELVLNGQTGAPLRVSAGISDFDALYVLSNGTSSATLTGGLTWRDIASVEITLTGTVGMGVDTVQRTLTNRFFPRNVLSR